MTNEDLLSSKDLRLRITKLEYQFDHEKSIKEKEKDTGKSISAIKDDFKKKIRKVYKDETGSELPDNTHINITLSEEKEIGSDSGYGGTAIQFKNRDINQVYFVSQGTQGKKDWGYDAIDIVTGKGGSTQYEDAKQFYNLVKKDAGEGAKVIGVGHSLGYNNNINLRLVDGDFDEVYGVNGAQSNAYQLYGIDDKFKYKVDKKFNLDPNDEKAIYKIDKDKLESFAKHYYKDVKHRTDNVHQTISKDDPLNGLTKNTRGFFQVGQVDRIDTDPNNKGIGDLPGIPDEQAQKVQNFFSQYGKVFENDGTDGTIKAATGFDMELVNKVMENPAINYFVYQNQIDQMIHHMDNKLPDMMKKVNYLLDHADDVLGTMVEAGYMSESDKKYIISELKGTKEDLQTIQDVVKGLDTSRGITNIADTGRGIVLSSDLAAYLKLKDLFKKYQDKYNNMQKAINNMVDRLHRNHGIDAVLAKRKDVYRTWKTPNGDKIKLNVSSAARIYHKGQKIIEQEKESLEKYKKAFDQEITEEYKSTIHYVKGKIHDMEANPSLYSRELDHNVDYAPRTSVHITDAKVHESFSPLVCTTVDSIPSEIHKQIKAHEDFLDDVKSSFKKMFDKDEEVAKLFK